LEFWRLAKYRHSNLERLKIRQIFWSIEYWKTAFLKFWILKDSIFGIFYVRLVGILISCKTEYIVT
jgi:hypothetical protein